MATRRFDINREQSLALISAGGAGSGADDHLPLGLSIYGSNPRFRGLIRFAHDHSGMVQVTKVVLYLRLTGGTHVAQGSGKQVRVQRNTRNWDSGGGGENSWSTSAPGEQWPGPTMEGATIYNNVSEGSGWVTTDITDAYLPYAPVSAGGDGKSNYGLSLRVGTDDDEDSASNAIEFYGMRSAYPPYLIVTYTTTPPNAAPTKPVITSPASGAVFPPGTTTIPLSFTGSDPDTGDTMSKWGYTWAAGPTSGTVTDLSTADGFNVTDHPLAVAGANIGYPDQLTVKTYDAAGLVSAVSAPITVTISAGPTVSAPTPAGGALADIHNAADLAIWASGVAHAKPILKFTYGHTAGRNMQAYRVRMYDDALAPLWDSGTVAKSAAVGAVTAINVPTAIILGTQYRWGVEVQDVDGAWSPAMMPTTFKVRWGQALYTENVTTAGKDFSWANTTPAQGRVQFLYRLANDAAGAGATAWSTALPSQPASPNEKAYLHVLVRLWATVAGQNPALPDMTLTYSKGAALTPDKWHNVQPANAAISLDPSVRRFGRYSLRVRALVTASHVLYPYRLAPGGGIEVMPDTDYTYSAFVRTNGPLGGGAIVRVGIRDTAGSAYIATLTPCDPQGAIQTNDSSAHPDGWQRLAGWFRVPPGTTAIQPDIWSNGLVVGNEYWVDGVKLEEGRVASTWAPGALGPAAVLDRAGVQIDGKEGGLFRLRSSGGVITELGPSGLGAEPIPVVHLASAASVPVPAGIRGLIVEVQAPGGAGGGTQVTSASQQANGAGGGGGGYARKVIPLAQLGATYAVVVPAAPAGVLAGNGPAGGATSFVSSGVTVSAAGGGGGDLGAATTTNAVSVAGYGGIGTGGDINLQGSAGINGRVLAAVAVLQSNGGSSHLGGGALHASGAAAQGGDFGGGGNGINAPGGTATTRAGGAGGRGCVIVTPY